MKKLIVLLVLLFSMYSFGEYQVYTYRATFRRIEPNLVTNGSTITTDYLKGYLVTVCCYPCGASMGKSYPNWLYVVRTKDKTKTLWKIPVQVDGGLFGSNIDAGHVDDTWADYLSGFNWDYGKLKPLLKPANKSWMQIYFKSDKFTKLTYVKKSKKICAVYDYGLLGYKNSLSEIWHSGFGSAGIKLNKALENYINPYIITVSGSVTGYGVFPRFSLDPSNYTTYDKSPINGTFIVRFNKTLTEKIRGYADWNIIDEIIYKTITHSDIVEGDENWSLWVK